MTKKFAFWFGLGAYFLTVLYYYGLPGIRLSESLFHVLPFWLCILTGKGMPLLPVVFFIAPVNAAIYGGIGAVTGWFVARFSAKFHSKDSVPSKMSSERSGVKLRRLRGRGLRRARVRLKDLPQLALTLTNDLQEVPG